MKIQVKNLIVKKDKRGWLSEIIKADDVSGGKFGQMLITVAHPGEVKGGHYHMRKKEWFCLIKGKCLMTLKNIQTGEKKDIILSDKKLQLIQMPLYVAHFFKNTGNEDMYLLAYSEELFNPLDPDTFFDIQHP